MLWLCTVTDIEVAFRHELYWNNLTEPFFALAHAQEGKYIAYSHGLVVLIGGVSRAQRESS